MKYGEDWELEKMTEDWLKEHDKDKKKTYKSNRQMKKKSLQEMPISNLSKSQMSKMENQFYSIQQNNDIDC